MADVGGAAQQLKYGGTRMVNAEQAHTIEIVARHASELAEATNIKDPAVAAHVMEMRDSNLRKLQVESSVGVVAALIAGFALSMIPAYVDVDDPVNQCRCAIVGMETVTDIISVCKYVHLLGLGAVAALGHWTVHTMGSEKQQK